MSDRMALETAIDLKLSPRWCGGSDRSRYRTASLRCCASRPVMMRSSGMRPKPWADRAQLIRSAAAFFIEQILFAPDADSYRVLGASPQASASQLRQHVGLLMRWVHPDLDPQGERSKVSGRVTAAWNDLKTPQRRAAYDEARRSVRAAHKPSREGQRGLTPDQDRRAQSPRRRRVLSQASIWRRRVGGLAD